MKTILVPVDFSDVTPALVDTVKQLAGAFESRVVLLHVAVFGIGTVSPSLMALPIETTAGLHVPGEALEKLKQSFAGSAFEVRTLLIDGGLVAANILAESKALHADLIVMGSHGHGALYNLLAGSATGGVIKSATCPVLVVPSPRGRLLAAA